MLAVPWLTNEYQFFCILITSQFSTDTWRAVVSLALVDLVGILFEIFGEWRPCNLGDDMHSGIPEHLFLTDYC